MKKVLLFLVLTSIVQVSQAQTWDEWFKQKKTQRKYLLQQIAALQVYLGYIKKGYDIASQGLTTIRNIKNGDFNLHRDFLGSLSLVNPKIKNYARVADIIALQTRIIKEVKETIKGIEDAGQLTPEEMSLSKRVFDNLLTEALKNIEELLLVITPGELEMKDDERLKRIDTIYVEMQEKYAFTAGIGEELAMLSVQRMQEQYEINLSRKLFGIE